VLNDQSHHDDRRQTRPRRGNCCSPISESAPSRRSVETSQSIRGVHHDGYVILRPNPFLFGDDEYVLVGHRRHPERVVSTRDGGTDVSIVRQYERSEANPQGRLNVFVALSGSTAGDSADSRDSAGRAPGHIFGFQTWSDSTCRHEPCRALTHTMAVVPGSGADAAWRA